jgi:hypothetical protein
MKLVAAAVCVLCAPALATAYEVNQAAPVPKAQFVAQGNAVCASTGNQIERVLSAGLPLLAESTPGFFARLAPAARVRADQLAALGRPTGDAAAERVIALAALVATDFERASADQAVAVRLFGAEGGANLRRFERTAKAYGLGKCVLPDDEEGDDRPPVDRSRFSPAKRAFIAQADAICRRNQRRDRPIERRYLRSYPPVLASWAKALPRFAANGRLELAGLRALTPPAADRARINALLRAEAAQIAGLERTGRLAAAGRSAVFERQLGQLFERGEGLSARERQYGFRVCGSEED